MTPTWDNAIRRCGRCNKLMRREETRSLCQECAKDARETGEVARLDPDISIARKIARLQAELELGGESRPNFIRHRIPGELAGDNIPTAVPGTACVKCGAPTLPGSTYCLGCHAGVFRTLGEAVADLHQRIGQVRETRPGMSGVSAELEEKRGRTATSRINPSGGPRLKG